MNHVRRMTAARAAGPVVASLAACCWLWPAAAAATACPAEPALQPAGKTLPHVADALRDGRRLSILAVGPATLVGPRLGAAASFPARTVQMLRAARPDLDIRLVTHTERGASAAELLAILRREIALHPADLVLWQTGTEDAARGRSIDEFESILREGVRTALAAGSDLVLIDPPFSRLLTAHADPARYAGAYLDAASPPGVAVFSRFALTRHWVEQGALDPERASAADRAAMVARLHECLAESLSRSLLGTPDGSQAATAAR